MQNTAILEPEIAEIRQSPVITQQESANTPQLSAIQSAKQNNSIKPPKKNNIGFTPIHQAAMAMKFQGKLHPEIAKMAGCSISTIEHWFSNGGKLHKRYAEYCDSLLRPVVPANHTDSQTVAERIKIHAPMAIDVIADLAQNSKRDQVKYIASADILDRAGYKPIDKSININAIEELNAGDLNSVVDSIMNKHGISISIDTTPTQSIEST